MSGNTQYNTQTGGTKITYDVNQFATNHQVTLGGRITGSIKITYRPSLAAKPTEEATDYETPDGGTVVMSATGGAFDHTMTIDNRLVSKIAVDDTGNTGDFWVHITSF
jgi:hypothetical protein